LVEGHDQADPAIGLRAQTPDVFQALPTEARAPQERWIEALGDPRLTALVKEAWADNPDLKQTFARLQAARAAARIAGAGQYPTLDVDTGAARTRTPVDTGDEVEGVYSSSLSAGATVRWEVDLWGRLRDRARAGDLDAAASAQEYRTAQQSLAGSVARAWFDLIEAQLLRAQAEDDLATQKQSVRLVSRRYDRGLAESVDLRLARSTLASREATLEARLRQEAEAKRALEILLGRYPAAQVAATQSLPSLGPTPPVGLPEELLLRRPDLKAAEARLSAAGLRADEARKALLPSLSASFDASTSGSSLADVLDPARLAATLLGSISAPIFQGGRLSAERERAEARAQEAAFFYVETALGAFQEAENALGAEDRLAKREAALAVALEEAQAAETLTERNYARGVATIFDLLDAQSRRISAETQLIGARAERLRNRVRLHLALGAEPLTPTTSDDQGSSDDA